MTDNKFDQNVLLFISNKNQNNPHLIDIFNFDNKSNEELISDNKNNLDPPSRSNSTSLHENPGENYAQNEEKNTPENPGENTPENSVIRNVINNIWHNVSAERYSLLDRRLYVKNINIFYIVLIIITYIVFDKTLLIAVLLGIQFVMMLALLCISSMYKNREYSIIARSIYIFFNFVNAIVAIMISFDSDFKHIGYLLWLIINGLHFVSHMYFM
jgi:hypothetical protein